MKLNHFSILALLVSPMIFFGCTKNEPAKSKPHTDTTPKEETPGNPGGSGDENPGQDVPEGTFVPFRLASYNIRYDSSEDVGDKDWTNSRKTKVAKIVTNYGFDVCGFVEVTQAKMRNDLKTLLGGTYTFKLCGRTDGATSGEAVGFGYKTAKFTLEQSGYFFLSETPEKPGEATYWATGGKTFNRSRLAVWGLFKDKESGAEFLYIVSHFELDAGMRAGSAALIVEKAKELAPKGVPVFFCGDLNAAPTETTCISVLTKYFKDAYACSGINGIKREGGKTTYNGYNADVSRELDSKRIDYMFFHGDNVYLKKYAVVYDLVDNVLPSDHYPIYIDVDLLQPAQ